MQFKQHLNRKSTKKENEDKNNDRISNNVVQTKSSVNQLLCDESIIPIEIKDEINVHQFVGQFIDKINNSFSLKRENGKVTAENGVNNNNGG